MVAMEGVQFVDDEMPALDGGMAKHLSARDHLKGDAAEAQANFDARMARVLALARPLSRQVLKVMIANDQVFGDAHNGGAERTIAVPHERTVGFVDLIALMTGRPQTGAAGDAFGVGVVFDRP